MSYTSIKKEEKKINFLASAIGLIRKSATVKADGVTADEYGYKTVKAGTIYPANDATAKGIIYEDVDVTDGDKAGSLIIAGHIFSDLLPEAPAEAAVAPLNASGIVFKTYDEAVTR